MKNCARIQALKARFVINRTAVFSKRYIVTPGPTEALRMSMNVQLRCGEFLINTELIKIKIL